jgi:molecular chaperone GrpE
MPDKKTSNHDADNRARNGSADEPEFQVKDRRHWVDDEQDDDGDDESSTGPARPTIVDGYRQRAEDAELKLREYIEAFKKSQEEQEQFRSRMSRDVDRRVELQFGELVAELLELLDDLDLALTHVDDVPEARPLAEGVVLARNRFLGALERRGVRRVSPDGAPFDPNEAEAMRVDPVDSAEEDGTVTETLRPGYTLGDRVIRAARVAVGRFSDSRD